MRAVRRVRDHDGKATQSLEILADKLVSKGLEGDTSALKEIGDRLDGRASQAIEHSGSITLGSLIDALWQQRSEPVIVTPTIHAPPDSLN